jgi:predicted dehydrogenase
MIISTKTSRREFVKAAAFTGISFWMVNPAHAKGNRTPNEKVNFACIGVGGKGDSDTADADRLGNVVAICDVDENTLNGAAQKYPKAQKFNDYRKMLDKIGNSIDAVTVSIPDHQHAPASSMAMQMGINCFCQKPLTHSIYEARRIGEIARHMKVATEMGNQGTASSNLRKYASIVKAGALGNVSEVHVWTNRPIWPQGITRQPTKPIPSNLHWDLWLGPAPKRPYADDYHPFNWRGWWDFGTGALGDMACHIVNLPFMALDLMNPTRVIAHTSGTNHDSYPSWSIIEYDFPANDNRGPLKMWWYDGGKFPPTDLLENQKSSDNGSLLRGDTGHLYWPGSGEYSEMIGGIDAGDAKFEESPGHFEEFIRAIKEGKPAVSNFANYAGPLTETVLIGNLAVWADGREVIWDSKNMKAKNAPEFDKIIYPHYQSGYQIG